MYGHNCFLFAIKKRAPAVSLYQATVIAKLPNVEVLSLHGIFTLRAPEARFQGTKKAAILRAQLRIVQQIRPVTQRFLKRLLPPPAANLLMITAAQHLGHGQSTELSRTSVVGIVEQSAGAVGGVQTRARRKKLRELLPGARLQFSGRRWQGAWEDWDAREKKIQSRLGAAQ
jgi:hypothetical protein